MNDNEDYDILLHNSKFSTTLLPEEIFNENFDINISNFDYCNVFNSYAFDASKFDVEYYKKHYLNNGEKCNPITHYLTEGVKKGFNPNPFFDTKWYLNENPDVKNANMNPFIHYVEYGIYEGRLPKLLSWDEFFKGLKNLKSTLKGRENYLFLVNDSNNEILQHFDKNYKNMFNPKLFLDDLHFKKKILSKNNIDYHFFIIPDKSIICKNFLPFKFDKIKRNCDSIKEIVDFSNLLDHYHYFKYDSHMNYNGGKLLTYKFLNHINKDFSLENYENLLVNKKDKYFHQQYDLLSPFNWSYSPLERFIFPREGDEYSAVPKNLKNLKEKIPNDFLTVRNRESFYYKNDNSFSDLKVLIFRDSSFDYLKWFFSFYFKEMFLYWDHGNFNKKLIEWYKPDLILEIRIERFLENIPRSSWVINREELNTND